MSYEKIELIEEKARKFYENINPVKGGEKMPQGIIPTFVWSDIGLAVYFGLGTNIIMRYWYDKPNNKEPKNVKKIELAIHGEKEAIEKVKSELERSLEMEF